ncbi:MAG: hypothetical protein HUK02_08505 [Bacteroidaceae bacterium]|nr:hypothetical protein [Bacteroidaceae bacterium]
MKRIAFLLCLVCALPSMAQKKKGVQQPALPSMTVEEAIADYNFKDAETLLNAQLAQLRKKKQPTIVQENQLAYVHKALQKINAVERVCFIDSVIVPRQQVLNHLCLSNESGRVSALVPGDSLDRTRFLSQLGDKALFAQPNAAGLLQLMEQDLTLEKCAPQPLAGISDRTGESQNYPYMMTDGATLYFAAQGEESLGGYDIFMSRYDADTHRYLTPENVGMPFNSAANDYLLCIDEFYNIGCFVTDRNMPTDKVCIYYFIPSNTRRVYIADELESTQLRNFARINSIKDTWTDELAVRVALNRLNDCRSQQTQAAAHDFSFILADNRICYSLEDFQSPQAKTLVKQWQSLCDEQTELTKQLDNLRAIYRSSKQTTGPQIIQSEQRLAQLALAIKQMEKDIRKAELGL